MEDVFILVCFVGCLFTVLPYHTDLSELAKLVLSQGSRFLHKYCKVTPRLQEVLLTLTAHPYFLLRHSLLIVQASPGS